MMAITKSNLYVRLEVERKEEQFFYHSVSLTHEPTCFLSLYMQEYQQNKGHT